MFKLTERILFLKFVRILKFVKIREFQEFLKFIKFEFSIYDSVPYGTCLHSSVQNVYFFVDTLYLTRCIHRKEAVRMAAI